MRITAGQFRSRVVDAPRGEDTRPTSSIVREAMFNILATKLSGARVLDLFCGSGILTFEAISRGAKEAVMVDASREAVQVAKRNAASLKITDCCRIYQNDYLRALDVLKRNGKRFDIGFFDPPYKAGYYQKALDAAFDGVFEEDAICICEYSTQDGFPFTGSIWEVADDRKYGSRSIAIVRRKQ
ncbi:MAG: 16S rRNA (guanine(966)-N(2))-methyltransferase RsmD [Clostridiales bacterium]|nr:16S rRNA (guanine(966)-N(2))-methyltransferase RsmD [Clostridiales bacterium]